MDTFIARFWWGLFYVLTLGLITIRSQDAEMDFVGWPYAIARWMKRRKPGRVKWCAACGKWGDHGSGTCPTITH